MRPHVGASVIYRDFHGDDYAAIVTQLTPSGAIQLTYFPPERGPMYTTCLGWSHIGDKPDDPVPGTWHWRTIQDELGPNGRNFVGELMASAVVWHSVLIAYANLENFRAIYNNRRAEAIAAEADRQLAEAAYHALTGE